MCGTVQGCDTKLPDDNIIQRDETYKGPGGSLESDGDIECPKVTVLSVDHGNLDGVMFFRRCPKCNMM